MRVIRHRRGYIEFAGHGAARRTGKPIARLLGDAIEMLIKSGSIEGAP